MARPRSTPIEPRPDVRFPGGGPHQGLGSRLSQVSYLWHRAMRDALEPLSLTPDEYLLLVGIARLSGEYVPITQVNLAEHTGFDVMMTSKIVRRMEKKKWIVREPHPSDTRAKSLMLTAAGAKIAQNALECVDEAERGLFFPLGEGAGEFADSLNRIFSRR